MIGDCEKYYKIALSERWDWARQSRVCFRCLESTTHRQNKCKEKGCEIEDCQERHHSLLHGKRLRDTEKFDSLHADDTTEPTEQENSDP